MIECPSCRANLKFDISSQKMHCEYCSNYYDPYEVEKDRDADETTEYETTIFSCPECGAEVIGDANEAAVFCSYCGGSTILNSRLSNSRRPKKIIPFRITKDECKEQFKRRVKRAIFAPRELRSDAVVDSFRGIYIPYWSFKSTQWGNLQVRGSKTRRRGNYTYTYNYELQGRLDAEYDGILYDASATFFDDISASIDTYNPIDRQDFATSFMSGFYADTADVSSDVYEQDARAFANAASERVVTAKMRKHGLSVKGADAKSMTTPGIPPAIIKREELVMHPVWFMSYRHKDRISYAAVNGQNGKIAVDLPIDPKRYLLFSGILAAIIFALMSFRLTVYLSAGNMLWLAAALLVFAEITYTREVCRLKKKESLEEDAGYLASVGKKKRFENTHKKMPKGDIAKTILGALFALIVAMAIFGEAESGVMVIISVIAKIAVPIVFPLVCFSIRRSNLMEVQQYKKVSVLHLILTMTSTLATTYLLMSDPIISPYSDIIYYSAAIYMAAIVIWDFLLVIKYYNKVAARKLPQFKRTGGDDRAK